MRKLTLSLDELAVESFPTSPMGDGGRGTVRALGGSADTGCDGPTAALSCEPCGTLMGPTCEYLSCNGPYVTCRVPCGETFGDASCGEDTACGASCAHDVTCGVDCG